MKRNGESGQLQRLNPQKQIGRTLTGENSLFSPLARSSSRRQTPTPFSAKRGTQPFAFHRGREPKSAVFGSLRIPYKRAMQRASRESLRIKIKNDEEFLIIPENG